MAFSFCRLIDKVLPSILVRNSESLTTKETESRCAVGTEPAYCLVVPFFLIIRLVIIGCPNVRVAPWALAERRIVNDRSWLD